MGVMVSKIYETVGNTAEGSERRQLNRPRARRHARGRPDSHQARRNRPPTPTHELGGGTVSPPLHCRSEIGGYTPRFSEKPYGGPGSGEIYVPTLHRRTQAGGSKAVAPRHSFFPVGSCRSAAGGGLLRNVDGYAGRGDSLVPFSTPPQNRRPESCAPRTPRFLVAIRRARYGGEFLSGGRGC